ncbi:hypothetical protein OK016_25875 [Vibrio chagasii]|nr:hypothetical protein [Vibrio chagasii]
MQKIYQGDLVLIGQMTSMTKKKKEIDLATIWWQLDAIYLSCGQKVAHQSHYQVAR